MIRPPPDLGCLCCKKPLPEGSRAGRFYCSPRCQSKYLKRRSRPPDPTEADFADLKLCLLALAERYPEAAGYVLLIVCPQQPALGEVPFPPPGILTKRCPSEDRSFRMSDRPYFSLAPFEVPRLPIGGRCRVELRDKRGRPIPHPVQHVEITAAFRHARFRLQGRVFDAQGKELLPQKRVPAAKASRPRSESVRKPPKSRQEGAGESSTDFLESRIRALEAELRQTQKQLGTLTTLIEQLMTLATSRAPILSAQPQQVGVTEQDGPSWSEGSSSAPKPTKRRAQQTQSGSAESTLPSKPQTLIAKQQPATAQQGPEPPPAASMSDSLPWDKFYAEAVPHEQLDSPKPVSSLRGKTEREKMSFLNRLWLSWVADGMELLFLLRVDAPPNWVLGLVADAGLGKIQLCTLRPPAVDALVTDHRRPELWAALRENFALRQVPLLFIYRARRADFLNQSDRDSFALIRLELNALTPEEQQRAMAELDSDDDDGPEGATDHASAVE